jgi:hypothetical protein
MTGRAAGASIAVVASIVLLAPAAAVARSATASQLRALAARAAAGDRPALAELRAVDTVDGRPAQLAAALDARTSQQLSSRLRTLAAAAPTEVPPQEGSAAAAQREAAAILSARRFGNEPVPNPIGSAFDDVGKWLAKLAAEAPGGPPVFWGAVAAVVLALTFLGARRSMRRLDPALNAGAGAHLATGDTPQSLERDASAAEARGAFGDAVRLRFRAGLLSLSARKAIDYRPSLLTTDVSRTLRSPEFDALAATFERIAYGGAPGAAADAAAAREGWRALLRRERR